MVRADAQEGDRVPGQSRPAGPGAQDTGLFMWPAVLSPCPADFMHSKY